ncbi:MAG: VOC family protein [Gemmataceae bacterium]|nr:VOC family protein [Gemmataceae bacterium]
MPVTPIPAGYHTVTPYMTVRGLKQMLEFVQKAFDASIVGTTQGPDSTIWHAAFRIGDSMLMAGEASEKWPAMPTAIYLYVPDTDATYKQALAAGAESVREPADQFYGDRNCGVKDMCGNFWWLGTHFEDVALEEVQRRATAAKTCK